MEDRPVTKTHFGLIFSGHNVYNLISVQHHHSTRSSYVVSSRNPLSPTFLFLSEGQQPLFPSHITLSLESASQETSHAY